MKNITLILILFISLRSFSQETPASWRSKPVKADGLATEWNIPLRFYNNETNMFFAIANDSTTLYLCFQIKDEKTQLKINEAGMKIELKAKGKFKCDATLDFPLADKKVNMGEEEKEKKEKPDINEMKNGFLIQNVNMSTAGFATQNGMIPIKDSSSIKVAINWDSKNVMTYEVIIPLKELFGNTFLLKDLTKTITMKVEVNAFTRPDSPNSADGPSANGGGMGGGGMSGGGGMPGGAGGGGMGGGGLGGGGGRGGGGHHNGGNGSNEKGSLFETNRLKQSFVLSTQPW